MQLTCRETRGTVPCHRAVDVIIGFTYCARMSELRFDVEPDGDWLVATCRDPEMATQAETLAELPAMIRDLVSCRFEADDPRLHWPIRIPFAQDPVLVAAA